MSNEAIVKDVATKGKYINLAISYLAKRFKFATIQEAKTFFRIEVDKYVERLLLNKLVFKAEHVLNNVTINPKFYFYEFYETCDNSDVRCAIINYLKKNLGENYEREHLQMTIELKTLKIVKSDERLREKYVNVISLEQFNELDAKVQKELLADVCFAYKCELVIEEMDKHVTWKHLLNQQLFVHLLQWIESVGNAASNLTGLDITFENILKNKFTTWEIDDEMVDEIKMPDNNLPDYVLNCLAERSIFMKNEEDNVDLLVKRIASSESMNKNSVMLSSRPHSMALVKSILDRNLHRFLIDEFVEIDDLIEVAPQYPHHQDEIELCIALKKAPPSDIATISTKITQYLMKKDENFRTDHPMVNFVEILLQENSTTVSPSPNDFNDIPLLKTILTKFESSECQNDFLVTLQDLVKRFEMVDLQSIKSDAGDEDLNFSNTSLFEVCSIFWIVKYFCFFYSDVFLFDSPETLPRKGIQTWLRLLHKTISQFVCSLRFSNRSTVVIFKDHKRPDIVCLHHGV